MLVKDVLLKYHAKVPFPWTIRKISCAGFIPEQLFESLGEELSQCEDIATPTGKKVIATIEKLKTP
ncbi:hypothetical protein ES708_29040 [subsurface metagenome]